MILASALYFSPIFGDAYYLLFKDSVPKIANSLDSKEVKSDYDIKVEGLAKLTEKLREARLNHTVDEDSYLFYKVSHYWDKK